RLSWLFELGPFLQSIMDSNWNKHQHEPWDSEGNLEYKRYFIRLHECPRASEAELPFDAAPTSYVAATGLGTDAALLPKSESRAGVFGYDRQTSMREISDGLSDTIMVIETDFQVGPWLAGGPPTARGLDSEALSYLGRGRPFGGLHRGGTMAVFADGTVHFIRDTIDREALEALFTIARGDQPGSVADWRVLPVELSRATRDWVVGHEPLNDLDAIPVRVGDEEPVARGDRRGFLRLDSAGLTVGPRGPGVGHAEGEVAWAGRGRRRRLQQLE